MSNPEMSMERELSHVAEVETPVAENKEINKAELARTVESLDQSLAERREQARLLIEGIDRDTSLLASLKHQLADIGLHEVLDDTSKKWMERGRDEHWLKMTGHWEAHESLDMEDAAIPAAKKLEFLQDKMEVMRAAAGDKISQEPWNEQMRKMELLAKQYAHEAAQEAMKE